VTRARTAAAGLAALLAYAAPAGAQGTPTRPPPRPWELSAGASFILPATLATTSASLLDADGSSVALFRSRAEAGAGLGLEAALSTPLSRRADLEVLGSWTRFEARAVLTEDLEDVRDFTATDTLTRFAVEGGVLFRLAERNRTTWYVRGSGGWMRELSGDAALAGDGLLVTAGVGFKYWTRPRAAGPSRLGVRAEFRMLNRRDGVPLDDGGFRLWPAAAGSMLFRF
jgi:hypothetical protein